MTNDNPLWELFSTDLRNLVDSYGEARLDFMGFPNNWKEVLLKKRQQ